MEPFADPHSIHLANVHGEKLLSPHWSRSVLPCAGMHARHTRVPHKPEC